MNADNLFVYEMDGDAYTIQIVSLVEKLGRWPGVHTLNGGI